MLTLLIFSNVWVLFLLAFLFMKFACVGGRQCSRARNFRNNSAPTPPKDDKPFDDKDIVPDGQSGF